MKHHTIGRLVKHRNLARSNLTGIVVGERLKETYDENGMGGCFVPQVKVEWIGEGKQSWYSRKVLKWSYEDESGEVKFH